MTTLLCPSQRDADTEAMRSVEARQELARREMARRSLSGFVRYRFHVERRRLLWNWHLDYLCDLLEAVWRREEEVRFLIINMPPRFLKSETIGQCWPAWMIGRDDSTRSSMLSAGATAKLAVRDSRKTLNIIRSPWYRRLFPDVKCVKEVQAEWETAGGATRNAAGREGQITGSGGDHLLWDDLILPREADSDLIREQANNFLGDTWRSRLNDQITGTITGIQQRLHEEDPTGYLIGKMKKSSEADRYKIVTMPNEAPTRVVVEWKGRTYATREPGSLLFPALFDERATKAFKALNPVTYQGQYQQEPCKTEGGELKTAWLQYIDQPVEKIIKDNGLKVSLYCDLASTKKQTQKDDPDYSVIVAMARDRWDRIHLLDIWRQQERSDVMCRELVRQRERYMRMGAMGRVKAEAGALRNGLDGTMAEVIRNLRKPGFIIEPISAPGDKVAKAQPLRYLAREKRLYLPRGGDWIPAFELEWRGFPNGGHDDQIDAVAYGALDLENLMPGKPPAKAPNIPGVITGDKLEEMTSMHKRIMERDEEQGDWWR